MGQAPGKKVHETGLPWSDASGDRLRSWLNINEKDFYDPTQLAILPMGFCYPGKGEKGDLPPRKECYPLWHDKFINLLPNLQLIILVGKYAQEGYLGKLQKNNLTETVKSWKNYLPRYLPLPHPSPLNNLWLAKNRWFEEELKNIQGLIAQINSDLTKTEKLKSE